jgi:hypothetical protein
MRTITIEQQILIHSTPNHTQFKDLLLKQIEDAPYEKRNNQEESITKTDYHIKETQREWVKTFVAYTQTTLQTILDTLQFQTANFPSVWFQQYTTNDFHAFHHHPMSNYSGIYYLELTDNTYTQILVNNKVTDIEVSEGAIVVLPSQVQHRCPKVQSNSRRTIISFNFDTHKPIVAK